MQKNMAKFFSETEARITSLFVIGTAFSYKGQSFTIISAGKPIPAIGECKTDTYVLAIGTERNRKEFKISIKQNNADFLENKINSERAETIFGDNWQRIISDSIFNIRDAFTSDYLVLFKKYGRTEANTMKIGWKFELMNKRSGSKSGRIKLNSEQLIDIYAGSNLDFGKRNAKVNGVTVEDSGVANFMVKIDQNALYDSQEVIDNLIPVEEYVKDKAIFFACKAINYRASRDKWDGNRPLAVYVDWQLNGEILIGEIVFNEPLSKKANEIGNNIKNILNTLNISNDNFHKLETHLSKTNYLK